MNSSSVKTHELKLRLQSCLQTILDLKGDLDAMPFGMSFLSEFDSLETFLGRMEEIELSENDISRIEAATDRFLRELKTLVKTGRACGAGTTGPLH